MQPPILTLKTPVKSELDTYIELRRESEFYGGAYTAYLNSLINNINARTERYTSEELINRKEALLAATRKIMIRSPTTAEHIDAFFEVGPKIVEALQAVLALPKDKVVEMQIERAVASIDMAIEDLISGGELSEAMEGGDGASDGKAGDGAPTSLYN